MANDLVNAVREHYGAVARGEQAACGGTVENVAAAIGYSKEELELAGDANLGLGCGNPLALTQVQPGMTVLDLGSGAGFDAFLAWNRVGPTGRVIGVDMTDDMLALARSNAEKRGATNVEFRKGYIEKLPVEDASVDYIISNCVINLSTDKPAVFREMARVLKPGGRFAVSDIVLLKPLTPELLSDITAYVGCIAGASMLQDYLGLAVSVGLRDLSIPSIQFGIDLMKAIAPSDWQSCCAPKTTSCCGSTNIAGTLKNPNELIEHAATAIASVKLHGRKPL